MNGAVSTFQYGPIGYSVTKKVGQVTTLTGAVNAGAPVGIPLQVRLSLRAK